MTCLYCGTSLADKRQGAKFCSARCRVAHNRNKCNTTSVTDKCNTTSVTDNSEHVQIRFPDRFEDYELIKITADVGTPQESILKIIMPKHNMVTRDFFRSRTGRAGLGRDYADLRQALARYSREILIQEIIAYRADLDDLREELTFKEVA